MNLRPSMVLAVALVPAIALGQNTVSHNCTLGELERRVEIFYEPGRTVPCEVHYYKDTEAPGDRQVLWSASSQPGFCEQKTDEFIAQLKTWGWDCGDVSAAAVEPPQPVTEEAAPVADDTDSLAPAAPGDDGTD